MNEIQIALEIATKAHALQKDKAGEDYIKHPVKVSSYCQNEKSKAAALLHDVLQDTPLTQNDLYSAGISQEIVIAVDILTKREGMSQEEYHRRIASNDIAIEVKFCDMRHNSDKSRWDKDKQDLASINHEKYKRRAVKLGAIIGQEKVNSLLSESMQHWLNDLL